LLTAILAPVGLKLGAPSEEKKKQEVAEKVAPIPGNNT